MGSFSGCVLLPLARCCHFQLADGTIEMGSNGGDEVTTYWVAHWEGWVGCLKMPLYGYR